MIQEGMKSQGVQFGILGSVTVHSADGNALALPRPRQRSTLSILLLYNGRRITKEELIDAIWGIELPGDPSGALRSNIYGLRKTLGINGRLQTGHNSYTLTLHEDDLLDLQHFQHLTRQAREAQLSGDIVSAAPLLESALGMWDDPPLADVPLTPVMQPLISELMEHRQAAQEALVDARLALGQHGDLLPSLMSLTTVEPLRERRWEQLMLALYRCGRQAEALDTFTRARGILVDEYGIEPGMSLKNLQQRILTGDPTLNISAPVLPSRDQPGTPRQQLLAVTATQPPITALHQPPVFTPPQRSVTVPHQLPAAPRQFIGREAELKVLSDLASEVSPTGSSPVVSLICGAPGVGKTALALHFAHQVASRFPDGQLYVDLDAFGPSADSVSSQQAIRSILDTLITSPRESAMGPDAEANLYRTILADRRMLILIDNASDSQHVRSLLPAAPQSMVITTSRLKLTGLITSHSARPITLDVLPTPEARSLLASRLGANGVTVDSAAVADISESCARLPLALVVAAMRAVARPVVPLHDLAAELREQTNRLNALSGTHPRSDIRTVFSWSYEKLTSAEAHMFRVLGAHRAQDITAEDASRLADTSTAQAIRTLTRLACAHLVKEYAPGRYRLNELMSAYAAEKAAEEAAISIRVGYTRGTSG